MPNLSRLLRAAAALHLLSGIAHLVAPDTLTGIVQSVYDEVLAVDFQPREATTTRVRLLGVASIAFAGLCYWLSTADST
ncbi:hypothetical protein [Halorientalis pallida]|uniref:Uncharacterized protein n=1 Tax=Halorientalis pallida TaxID=2479928 RepID=A0A498L6J7_9EURY|nr:hypothetical protein [Halorientalis pallida]RXK50325.1 hypothetical protein EAF64_07115 [Halorientalis pallida]